LSATLVESAKFASAVLDRPDPPSNAVQSMETLFGCHPDGAAAHVIVGAVLSETAVNISAVAAGCPVPGSRPVTSTRPSVSSVAVCAPRPDAIGAAAVQAFAAGSNISAAAR